MKKKKRYKNHFSVQGSLSLSGTSGKPSAQLGKEGQTDDVSRNILASVVDPDASLSVCLLHNVFNSE